MTLLGEGPVFLQSAASSPELLLQLVLQLVLAALVVAGMWKTFQKAGEPGWAAIIPIYNIYVILRITGGAWWWLLLLFIPVINFVALVKISVDLAGAFGRGILFGLGLTLLPIVFYPILGFGGSRYQATT
ncbi:DUF5684 domain-containing protein [Halobellus clavatus]|uniref:Signal peptidase I n=1 Tax=Halobellus clavatus TaxID=660517 RepID=A0A1H3IB95_9EURY|nr:DUF5684 domain-containing protein [Halobellus clavatus]SDY24519.1 hypothetical protein SAMN04487946_10984 [Halobellus clavatus]